MQEEMGVLCERKEEGGVVERKKIEQVRVGEGVLF